MRLLECVPNVSEGRRLDVVARLAAAVDRPGVRLLHTTSDPDHHRSVLTFAGTPAALGEAVVALFAAALSAIDLRQHAGIHPRIGAVDVVPFVPLAGSSWRDAEALAREVAAEVAQRFALPVFLYERSATRPERRNLAEVRRGGLEGLAARLGDGLPNWLPDFGPPRLHPTAGAAVVGARDFLVAFNVVLATAEAAVARRVAARVRAAGGGLPAVKAMGVFLASRGLAQVSMNLVDYRQTSIYAAYERVRDEAARLGVGVVESEIVGLVPEAALSGGDVAELGLVDFSPERVLEHRLRAVGLTV